MFPKILPRHHNLRGAVFYVFTTGGRTVHTDPHIVAAWDEQLCDPVLARPDKTGLRALVDRMDAPRVLRAIEVKAGHVYHVPIAAHRDDGLLGDDQWRQLAYEVVGRLGLSGCRWIAVHHGPSRAGNDHIHLIVQLVGDNGKLARLSYDKTKIRAWAREVEERLDLVRTGPDGTGARPLSRAEHDRARTTGIEPQRRTLERLVRAAAGAAHSAEQFVATLHDQDVTVHPRIHAGRVVGYSVALHPDLVHDDAPALELSGSQLARDLSLARLQARWADDYTSDHPDHWTTSRPVYHGGAARWRTGHRRVQEALRELSHLHPNDRSAWHAAIDQAADFAAMLSVQVDPTDTHGLREPLRAAATDLAAAARLSRPNTRSPAGRPHPIVLPTLLAATRLLARTHAPELAVALLVIAAFAALVLALADRQRYDRKPGQSGAHLRTAAARLAPYQPRTEPARPSTTTARQPKAPTSAPSVGERPPIYRPPTQVPRGRTR
ncbi:MAG TPA: hypothetical protein VFV67_19005 [Actinophytocola sp.]|uniref:relaxase/mobilization nuclease domain-containing protein n=1 Tax=Actinophytocola sp. TaxID=1872138 RepID=UPI002DBACB69|nr:hypothetical protein [Actinophytocola sp.]HEU5472742.1 hypothetical protein [Actinophytocola sp.]